MKSKILGWTAIWVIGAAGASAQAVPIPITYDLAFTGGKSSLSGTITTDGKIGAINAADITAWSFTQSGSYPFSISSGGSAYDLCLGSSGCFTATATALNFKFESSASFDPYAGFSSGMSVAFSDAGLFAPFGVIETQCNSAACVGFPFVLYAPTGDVVGTSAVPLPASIWLILSGLAGLGLAGGRRGQTAAV
jgi:hypothetical protein